MPLRRLVGHVNDCTSYRRTCNRIPRKSKIGKINADEEQNQAKI